MCFTKKIKRERKRIKRIHPQPKKPSFTAEEMICCSGCYQKFKLDQIKINCAGCDQFFHCKIAGTCNGLKCNSLTNRGLPHKLSWCIRCVPNIPENEEKMTRDESCICNECHKY